MDFFGSPDVFIFEILHYTNPAFIMYSSSSSLAVYTTNRIASMYLLHRLNIFMYSTTSAFTMYPANSVPAMYGDES